MICRDHETGVEFTVRDVAEFMAEHLDPDLLRPTADGGGYALCRLDDRRIWETSGYVPGEGWHVAIGEERAVWPDGVKVFDPYEARKLCTFMVGGGVGVAVDEGEVAEVVTERLRRLRAGAIERLTT